MCIFDYLDTNRDEAWRFIDTCGHALADCLCYHATDVIDRVFRQEGFVVEDRILRGAYTYVVARKT